MGIPVPWLEDTHPMIDEWYNGSNGDWSIGQERQPLSLARRPDDLLVQVVDRLFGSSCIIITLVTNHLVAD